MIGHRGADTPGGNVAVEVRLAIGDLLNSPNLVVVGAY
jgi:hypothetical protein